MSIELASKPLIDYWNRGLMTGQELVRLCSPLRDFLKGNNLKLPVVRYLRVVDELAQQKFVVRPYFLGIPGYRKSESLVDNDYVSHNEDEFRGIVNKRDESRSTDEMGYYRSRILRRPNIGARGYDPITLDTALVTVHELLGRSRGMSNFSVDDLIQEGQLRALPYLEGRRGDFLDFDTFMKKMFPKIRRSVIVDQARRDERQNLAARAISSSETNSEIEEMQIDLGELLDLAVKSNLSALEMTLVELRLVRKLRYYQIASLFDNTYTREYLYECFGRALDKLSPRRKKQKSSQTTIPTSKLIDGYRRIRERSLIERGLLPSSQYFERAKKEGLVDFTPKPLMDRFGSGSWSVAQRELERILRREG